MKTDGNSLLEASPKMTAWPCTTITFPHYMHYTLTLNTTQNTFYLPFPYLCAYPTLTQNTFYLPFPTSVPTQLLHRIHSTYPSPTSVPTQLLHRIHSTYPSLPLCLPNSYTEYILLTLPYLCAYPTLTQNTFYLPFPTSVPTQLLHRIHSTYPSPPSVPTQLLHRIHSTYPSLPLCLPNSYTEYILLPLPYLCAYPTLTQNTFYFPFPTSVPTQLLHRIHSTYPSLPLCLPNSYTEYILLTLPYLCAYPTLTQNTFYLPFPTSKLFI